MGAVSPITESGKDKVNYMGDAEAVELQGASPAAMFRVNVNLKGIKLNPGPLVSFLSKKPYFSWILRK